MAATKDNPTVQPGTREALLEAAAEVIAETGFRSARVRDICERAGANVAAVNYHFGDKEGLYAALIQSAFDQVIARFPLDAGITPSSTPEERFLAFVRGYLQRILAAGAQCRHGRIVMREMVEPTSALDLMVEKVVKPTSLLLDNILRQLLGPGFPEASRRQTALSIIGQIVFYAHCRPVLERMNPDFKLDQGDLESLVNHVAQFSLGGIRALKDAGQTVKRKRTLPGRNIPPARRRK